MGTIFRKEAIARQSQRLHGDILLLPPLKISYMTWLILSWATLVAIWLCCAKYAKKETVNGWLEPSSGAIRVYPQDGGVIKKIFVKEGDFVKQDQPLMEIDDDKVLENGDRYSQQLIDNYVNQRALIDLELQSQGSIAAKNLASLSNQLASSESVLRSIERQLPAMTDRLHLASAQAKRLQELGEKGFVSASELDSSKSQVLQLESQIEDLNRSRLEQKNSIQKLQTQLATQPAQDTSSLSQLRTRLHDINQLIIKAKLAKTYVIKAPNEGVVNNLQAYTAQRIQNVTNPLLTILPRDDELIVHLLVPVRAAGFIEPMQKLNIRYDAFPYQKFGLYEGTVTTISNTVLLPNEIPNAPIKTNDSVYRVTAKLKKNNVDAYGKKYILKPGMTLNADITLTDRTLISWLLEPIYSLNGRI